jgi:hypothetical protein
MPFGNKYGRSKTAKTRRRNLNFDNQEVMAQSSLAVLHYEKYETEDIPLPQTINFNLKSYENTSMVTAGPTLKKIPQKSYKKLSLIYPKILNTEK